jgi:DNA topoisomerase VI subunit B
MAAQKTRAPVLHRATLKTSRLLDFASEKELTAQIGHPPEDWPLVAVKELVDNALDACEEAGIAPVVSIRADRCGLTVEDNGPGIDDLTIEGVLDFSIRVSSREAYVSPTRGAQGNALKTLIAMPYVIDPQLGSVSIETVGQVHTISFDVDRIHQKPVIDHEVNRTRRKKGTKVRLNWPDLSSSLGDETKSRFLQIVANFGWLNPHLDISLSFDGEREVVIKPTDPQWAKWKPRDPTSPHWYQPQHLERLIAGYVANERDITVREFVSEFHGLTGTAKQKRVLEATGLARERLSNLVHGRDLDHGTVARLVAAMQDESKPVKPVSLGIIGGEHFRTRFARVGCMMESFQYARRVEVTEGLPELLEVAFGFVPKLGNTRRLITGVNWSSGILNPFRELGDRGYGIDRILAKQFVVDEEEPVIVAMHLATPRPQYLDRGKSSLVTT